MAKQVCIVCAKEKKGTPIREDIVINTIRAIKGVFKASTGNKLVVCDTDFEAAKKRREKFEKAFMTYAGIGAVLGVILLIFSLLSSFDIWRLVQSVFLLVLLVVIMAILSLYQYFPAMALSKEQSKEQSKEEKKAGKKEKKSFWSS